MAFIYFKQNGMGLNGVKQKPPVCAHRYIIKSETLYLICRFKINTSLLLLFVLKWSVALFVLTVENKSDVLFLQVCINILYFVQLAQSAMPPLPIQMVMGIASTVLIKKVKG